ncbi:3-hydroxybutyrate dehydrogenase [Chengkuizengella axinellae]|uniref:3-hydroxybutyrate dehydrogenase n=1 Tax=Chengkuizengella axinellae TaxID=3064388 RepID=A0ABT9J1Y1_9BACL|nr:3-hydroxybutyrate dehydrogenase [Chengkuizengella sp. 2205SS18-9]MDP5275621.1 3-hydroxybutyrate dehydrogenase [Chengkuizengella sp. 2205SS18-9]
MTGKKQRTVLITGAARGIGLAMAKAFVDHGDFVAIGDLDSQETEEAASQIGDENAMGYALNVAEESSVVNFVERVTAERGTVDVIINNAGLQYISKVEEFPLEKWNLLIDVMLTGPFLLIKHTMPYMKKQKYGRIINISSVHGKTASPYKSAYISAKHGLVGLTRTIAHEGAEHGITSNAIMPGVVDTLIIRNQLAKLAHQEGITEEEALNKHMLHKQAIKQAIKAEDIAACAVYLASEGAALVTGECISVSGGW